MFQQFQQIVVWIVDTVGQWGYPGIVMLMFLESSFFPFPSEVVVAPAGYLASQGQMSLGLIIASGVAGSLLGALFNYWLGVRLGSWALRPGLCLLSRKAAESAADRGVCGPLPALLEWGLAPGRRIRYRIGRCWHAC